MDALAVIHMSLEASPTLVVTHFTMANILAAQGFYVDASGFYESTLHYQPQFQPAAERLRSGRCLILLSRKRIEDDKRKELESAENT
ncbi:tetratricopeptide repeat protein 17-like [Halichondria panicea]